MKDKVVIFKKPDLGIIKIHYHEDKFGEGKRDFREDRVFKKYLEMGYDYFVTDMKNIPSKKGIESRKQLYHDGDEVKFDSKWEYRLMPDQLIKSKHITRLNSKLDKLLSSKNADPIEALRIAREIEKHKAVAAGPHNTDLHWLKVADSNLDERVKSGESDKPKIRKAIKAKLEDLKLQTKE